jgi:hypothetical protein
MLQVYSGAVLFIVCCIAGGLALIYSHDFEALPVDFKSLKFAFEFWGWKEKEELKDRAMALAMARHWAGLEYSFEVEGKPISALVCQERSKNLTAAAEFPKQIPVRIMFNKFYAMYLRPHVRGDWSGIAEQVIHSNEMSMI